MYNSDEDMSPVFHVSYTKAIVVSIPFDPFSPIQAFLPLLWMGIMSIPQQDHSDPHLHITNTNNIRIVYQVKF